MTIKCTITSRSFHTPIRSMLACYVVCDSQRDYDTIAALLDAAGVHSHYIKRLGLRIYASARHTRSVLKAVGIENFIQESS